MKKLILTASALLCIAALSASAYPPPEKDEMRLDKLANQLDALNGKVIEMEFSYARSLQNENSGNYSVLCTVWTSSGGDLYRESGINVFFSGEEAKAYFDDIMEKREDPYNESAGESVFVLVDGRKLIALGEKYKKSKGTYSW